MKRFSIFKRTTSYWIASDISPQRCYTLYELLGIIFYSSTGYYGWSNIGDFAQLLRYACFKIEISILLGFAKMRFFSRNRKSLFPKPLFPTTIIAVNLKILLMHVFEMFFSRHDVFVMVLDFEFHWLWDRVRLLPKAPSVYFRRSIQN